MAREWNRETIHCTLRLPDDGMYERIRELAALHGRPLNTELVLLLRAALTLGSSS